MASDQTAAELRQFITDSQLQATRTGTPATAINMLLASDSQPAVDLPRVLGTQGAEQSLTAKLTDLGQVTTTQTASLSENTKALETNTTAKNSSSTNSVISNVQNAVGGLLGSTISSVVPIVSSLVHLFRRDPEPPPVLPKFSLPPEVKREEGVSQAGTSVTEVDYGANGLPRSPDARSSPQITVQVQAMDSKSFLDHSEQIAMAVRKAMLSAHPINDVVMDL